LLVHVLLTEQQDFSDRGTRKIPGLGDS